MTKVINALIAPGHVAVRSLADTTGQAVRDNLFEIGRGLVAARQRYQMDQDFSAWLHSSPYSFIDRDERAALLKLGEYEGELRPLIEASTLTSARAIWRQFSNAAEALRSCSSASPLIVEISKKMTGSEAETEKSGAVALRESDDSRALCVPWVPPRARPKNQTKLTKKLGDNADHLYGWFSTNAIRQTLSPLTSEQRGRPVLKTIAATVLDGSCRHARTADIRQFDVRMAFPHLPEKFARGTFGGKRPPTIYKIWSRLAKLNKICAEHSKYTVEAIAPNGIYLLRTPEHEHETNRLAHQWWQTGSLPSPRNQASNDHALPEGSPELVFHGARVWPYENETISFDDACNTYRLVAELHGMLQAMLKSDKPGRAIKLRHYAKWMRRLSSPGADIMFRMASAINQNPDKEFDVKPPPLEVIYGE